MGGLGAMLYASACGIVASGLVCALHRALVGDDATFSPPVGGLPAWLWAVLLSAFAGPLIVLGLAVDQRGPGVASAMRAGLVGALALFWSFCSGVVIIQSLLLVADAVSG